MRNQVSHRIFICHLILLIINYRLIIESVHWVDVVGILLLGTKYRNELNSCGHYIFVWLTKATKILPDCYETVFDILR